MLVTGMLSTTFNSLSLNLKESFLLFEMSNILKIADPLTTKNLSLLNDENDDL